jgi:hypothetical protein
LLTIGVFFLVVPISGFIGRKVGGFRQKIQAQADRRLKLTNELLSSIRIVKFYAWEDAFIQNISKARENELKEVGLLGYWRSTLITLMYQNSTVIIGLCCDGLINLLFQLPFLSYMAFLDRKT